MKVIAHTLKSNFSPAALLAAITLGGVAVGGMAYASTHDLDHQYVHGYGRCTSCGCGSYSKSPHGGDYCRCGHSYYDHL